MAKELFMLSCNYIIVMLNSYAVQHVVVTSCSTSIRHTGLESAHNALQCDTLVQKFYSDVRATWG